MPAAEREAMEALAAVQARIAEIQARFPLPPSPAPAPAGSLRPGSPTLGGVAAGSPDFARVLAQAAAAPGALDAPGAAAPIRGASAEGVRFAHDLLRGLGAPATAENLRAISAWIDAEGTRARFNPLATTQSMPGATNFNSVGVKDYVSYEQGLEATLITLRNGRYDAVLAALAAGTSALAVGQAVAASPWGTGDGLLRRL